VENLELKAAAVKFLKKIAHRVFVFLLTAYKLSVN